MPSQTLPLNLEKPQHLLNFDQIKVFIFACTVMHLKFEITLTVPLPLF